ncbi:c-type cytochrome biogenesis protein CcmI [Psychromonas sp.]|uniref:c-type cytochrome biogenesis protein CcmI n=1 Tax=Psychromonas sp. TaxID=1884585 RepID=UPI00356AA7B9
MILQFWLASILLVIIACALLTLPFIRRYKNDRQSDRRNQLNRALYDVRLAELEADEAQDIIVDKKTLLTELQHNLLDDISDNQPKAVYKNSKMLWLPAIFVVIFGSYAIYWSVGAYQQVDSWQSVLQRYPDLQNRLFNDRANRPSEQDLRDIMLGLRTQLSYQDNDPDGWLLYSRLALLFRDSDAASDAINKAYQLDPSSIEIRLVYIQMKMQSGDPDSQVQAESLLNKVLKDYPEDLEAWSMYAFMALEREDYATAIQRWQKMQTLVAQDSQQAATLRDSIAYAQQQLNAAKNSTDVDSQVDTPDDSMEEKIAPVGEVYQVEIAIDKQVIIPQNGFLFVYAQAVAGPPMPIAAIKMPLPDFPVRVELSDANAMMEGVKLSNYPNFIIKARISTGSNINNSAGQWQGQSGEISAGEKEPIQVVVSELLQ